MSHRPFAKLCGCSSNFKFANRLLVDGLGQDATEAISSKNEAVDQLNDIVPPGQMVAVDGVYAGKPFILVLWRFLVRNMVSRGGKITLGAATFNEVRLVLTLILSEHYVVRLYVTMDISDAMELLQAVKCDQSSLHSVFQTVAKAAPCGGIF